MSNALDTPYGSINVYLQSTQASESVVNAGVPVNANSNKIWYLNTPITLPRPDVKMLCAVTDFQCAYSWYIIRAGINDTVAIQDNQLNGNVKFFLVIPEGNYDSTQFLAALNNLYTPLEVAAGLFGLQNVTGWVDQVLTYDPQTNKVSYIPTAAIGSIVILFNQAGGTTADREIGIENSPNITGVLGPIEPLPYPSMVDLAGIPYIYVIAPTLGLENRNSKGDIDLTLCKVPVTTQPLGFVYLPTTPGSVHLHLQDIIIKKLQIVLQDDEGNELDLHGIGWGLTLTIHFQYLRLPSEPRLVLDGQVATEDDLENEGDEEN